MAADASAPRGSCKLLRPLSAALDALEADVTELIGDLIAIDSTNPHWPGVERASVIGGESACNRLLQERFRSAGLETHWLAPDPERGNLIALLRGTGGGRSVVLNAHVDTVPPGSSEAWRSGDPWRPIVVDGALYGLGATDMKGAVGAMWAVAKVIRESRISLLGDLQFHCVVGEERMEHQIGTSACIARGSQADAAIVMEPTAHSGGLRVATATAGGLHLRITLRGRSTHAGNRASSIRAGGEGDTIGVNALEKAVILVRALQDLETHWQFAKTDDRFPPGFFTLLPGVFHADAGYPVPFYIPDAATLEYSISYPPKDEASIIRGEVEDYVLQTSKLDPWLARNPPSLEWLGHWPPLDTSPSEAVARVLMSANGLYGSEPSDSTISPTAFQGLCDGSFYQAAGIPAIVFGPGTLRCAHAPDECVVIADVMNCAKTLLAFVIEWCGVQP